MTTFLVFLGPLVALLAWLTGWIHGYRRASRLAKQIYLRTGAIS